MITLAVKPGRLRCASTQPFRLMKTNVNCIFTVLGSTGNAYVLAVAKHSITCNCPNSHSACKHIIFLLSVCGFSGRRQLSFLPANLLQKLHADPPSNKLKGALLDEHTNNLCSTHLYPSCYFCNQKPSGTLTICSSCGFLSHHHCHQLFLSEDNDDGSHCPRCGIMSPRFSSHFIGGHQNFFHILCHQGYPCLAPSELHASCEDMPAIEQDTSADNHPTPPQFAIPIVPDSVESDLMLVLICQPPQDL